jgi:RHS repeat-associated protein
VWFWDHDPFGNGTPTGSFTNRQIFPGQFQDGETGLNYNMARDYDPKTGRYIESDPIGLDGGINPYIYVKNDPLNHVDPTGKFVFLLPFIPVAFTAAAEFATGFAIGMSALPLGQWLGDTVYSDNFPPGYWPGPQGAAEWGRRNGVGAREGKGRFHGIKQGCTGSRGTDAYGVNPDTGDVIDPSGDVVGNLDGVKSK